MEFYSVGVYNASEESFFGRLTDNGIDTFCDIRRRRGVRGARYKFVNSRRLQEHLAVIGIQYLHIEGLAPTNEIRILQKEADVRSGTSRRKRAGMDESFVVAYEEKVLNGFDFGVFLDNLRKSGAQRIVFFCVEDKPETCHRSIVTKKLEELNFTITHL